MQHYSFHIGDYIKDTAHLSDAEDLCYRRLLDMYYDQEGPISLDVKMVCRKARVQQDVAEQILSEFFTKAADGYRHMRCDSELAAIYAKSESARISAEKRWEGKRNANAMRTHTEGNATHNPPPITQDPLPTTQDPAPKTEDQKPEATPKSKPLQPAAPAAPKKKVADVESLELQAVCRETWGAYGEAYAQRYGTPPVRNAKISGQIKQFCRRVPAIEAPAIAAFYVTHNNAFYVTKGHAVGQLLADAEKLRTEWATNQTITVTQARQTDQTQANGNIFGKLIAEAKERERNGTIQQAT